MRTVIYARKSTESDERQAQSLEDQINALTALAMREGLVVAEVFQEPKSAKAPYIRTEFDRLVKAIERGSVSKILTWSMDRLSRNPVDGGLISYLLQTGKLELIRTIDHAYRPDDNALILSIQSGMATAYLQDLSRNVKRGLKGKVERGWHPCKAPVGYKNDSESGEIVIDPERFSLMRRAFELSMAGTMSIREIHREVVALGLTVHFRKRKPGPLSLTQLHRLLRNPFYCGQILYCGETYPGRHTPIVTPEEWRHVQKQIEAVSRPTRQNKLALPYSGLFRCAACGCRIVGLRKVKRYRGTNRTAIYTYYHCSGWKGCSRSGVREEKLEACIKRELLKCAIPRPFGEWLKSALIQSFEHETADRAKSIAALQSESARLQNRLSRLTDLRLDNELTPHEFQEARARLLGEIEQMRRTVEEKRDEASTVLRLIYERIDAAVASGELKSGNDDPSVLAKAAQHLGEPAIGLRPLEFRLDSITQKIATCEPLRSESRSAERDDFLSMNSFWLAFCSDLRTAALETIESRASTDDRILVANDGDLGGRVSIVQKGGPW